MYSDGPYTLSDMLLLFNSINKLCRYLFLITYLFGACLEFEDLIDSVCRITLLHVDSQPVHSFYQALFPYGTLTLTLSHACVGDNFILI